jgi:hypothetical protein
MLHRSIRGPASEESNRSSPVAGTGTHHAVVEAEEIEPFPANLQTHDALFRFLRLQPEIGQQVPKPLDIRSSRVLAGNSLALPGLCRAD